MLGAIKYAFANLANPSGRDGRQTFWYWVLFITVLRFGAGMVVSVPMMTRMMASIVEAAKSGNQDPAAVQAMTMQIVTAEMPRMMWAGIIIGAATMLLLAASLARRLHDSNLSGWLVLIPGALYAAALATMPAQIDQAMELMRNVQPGGPPDITAMMQGQGSLALLSWIPALLVIWFGVRKSSDGPNRFGEAPVRF